jgi:hypothetical protein
MMEIGQWELKICTIKTPENHHSAKLKPKKLNGKLGIQWHSVEPSNG